MPYVYYKFRSTIEYEKIQIPLKEIYVGEFKRLITEQKNIPKAANMKIEVKNATTDRVYTDDADTITENSSLILRRVPIDYEAKELGTKDSLSAVIDAKQSTKTINELSTMTTLYSAEASEQEKMKAIMTQNQSVIDHEHNQNGAFQKARRPPVCYHCKNTGHVYRTCPQLSNLCQVKRDEPTHIFLKSQLGLLPSDSQSAPFRTPLEKVNANEVPEFLRCPICLRLMESAVIAPCCGASFCDNCINEYLTENDFKCFECKGCCSSESIVPNQSLRKSILTFMGANASNGSSVPTVSNSAGTPITSLKNLLDEQLPSTNQDQRILSTLATQVLQSLLKCPTNKQIVNQHRNNSHGQNFSSSSYSSKSVNRNKSLSGPYRSSNHHCMNEQTLSQPLLRKIELFNIMESLSYTKTVLNKEQFYAVKNHIIDRLSEKRRSRERELGSVVDSTASSIVQTDHRKHEENTKDSPKEHSSLKYPERKLRTNPSYYHQQDRQKKSSRRSSRERHRHASSRSHRKREESERRYHSSSSRPHHKRDEGVSAGKRTDRRFR